MINQYFSKQKKISPNMQKISDVSVKASNAGMTYGEYVAYQYMHGNEPKEKETKKV